MATTLKNTLIKNTLIRLPTIEDYNVSAPETNIDFTDFATLTFGAGTYISGGEDKTGNGNDCAEAQEAFQPTYIPNAHNGKSGAAFIGADRLRFGTGKFGSGDDPYTFIIVSKMSISNPNSIYFWNGSQSVTGKGIMLRYNNLLNTSWWNDNFSAGALNINDFFILDTWWNKDTSRRGHYVNNVDVGSEIAAGKDTDPTKNCQLGNATSSAATHIMLEYFYWKKALTAEEHKNAYRFLNDKFGII